MMLFVVFWCYGTLLSVNAAAAADFWGSQNAGANYGMLSTAWAIAGIIGPMISALTGGYGNYSTLLYWAAGMALVALLCELAARRPTSPDDTPETAGR